MSYSNKISKYFQVIYRPSQYQSSADKLSSWVKEPNLWGAFNLAQIFSMKFRKFSSSNRMFFPSLQGPSYLQSRDSAIKKSIKMQMKFFLQMEYL